MFFPAKHKSGLEPNSIWSREKWWNKPLVCFQTLSEKGCNVICKVRSKKTQSAISYSKTKNRRLSVKYVYLHVYITSHVKHYCGFLTKTNPCTKNAAAEVINTKVTQLPIDYRHLLLCDCNLKSKNWIQLKSTLRGRK